MANRLKELYLEFKKGHIGKKTYIHKMYRRYKILGEYQEFIQGKNITAIEILENKTLLTTKDGIAMLFNFEDEHNMSMAILSFGDFERDELSMVRNFLRKDSVILDIGANVGWYSLNLSRDVPNGSIMAFEPIPKTFGYLKQNIKMNNMKNIKIYNFGLSDKKGVFKFSYNPKRAAAATLSNSHEGDETMKIKCKVKRLDDFILNITDSVDFIKCDVEGAELYVLRGGFKVIEKYKPVLLLEMLRKWSAKFGYHPDEIIRLLARIGYSCFYINGEKLVKVSHMTEKTMPTNFCFLEQKKHSKFIKRLVSV